MLNRKKYYHIGEVARVLGISTETIRYYEYEHLITPVKDAENKYRLYSFENIIELQQLVFFRKVDLSIAEIRDILKPVNANQLQQFVNNKSREVQQKIHSLELLLHKFREIDEMSSLIDTSLGKHIIRPLPSYYIMQELTGGNILRDYEDQFFDETVYNLCTFGGLITKSNTGWTIEQEYLLIRRRLVVNLGISDQIVDKKIIESRRGGYTIHRYDGDECLYDACEGLLGWLEAEGYHPAGNFIYNHMATISGIDEAGGYAEVFVPVI